MYERVICCDCLGQVNMDMAGNYFCQNCRKEIDDLLVGDLLYELITGLGRAILEGKIANEAEKRLGIAELKIEGSRVEVDLRLVAKIALPAESSLDSDIFKTGLAVFSGLVRGADGLLEEKKIFLNPRYLNMITLGVASSGIFNGEKYIPFGEIIFQKLEDSDVGREFILTDNIKLPDGKVLIVYDGDICRPIKSADIRFRKYYPPQSIVDDKHSAFVRVTELPAIVLFLPARYPQNGTPKVFIFY